MKKVTQPELTKYNLEVAWHRANTREMLVRLAIIMKRTKYFNKYKH